MRHSSICKRRWKGNASKCENDGLRFPGGEYVTVDIDIMTTRSPPPRAVVVCTVTPTTGFTSGFGPRFQLSFTRLTTHLLQAYRFPAAREPNCRLVGVGRKVVTIAELDARNPKVEVQVALGGPPSGGYVFAAKHENTKGPGAAVCEHS